MGTAPPRARLRPGYGIRPGRGVRGCDSDACGFPVYVQPDGSERAGIGGGGVLMELDRGAVVGAVEVRRRGSRPLGCKFRLAGCLERSISFSEKGWDHS